MPTTRQHTVAEGATMETETELTLDSLAEKQSSPTTFRADAPSCNLKDSSRMQLVLEDETLDQTVLDTTSFLSCAKMNVNTNGQLFAGDVDTHITAPPGGDKKMGMKRVKQINIGDVPLQPMGLSLSGSGMRLYVGLGPNDTERMLLNGTNSEAKQDKAKKPVVAQDKMTYTCTNASTSTECLQNKKLSMPLIENDRTDIVLRRPTQDLNTAGPLDPRGNSCRHQGITYRNQPNTRMSQEERLPMQTPRDCGRRRHNGIYPVGGLNDDVNSKQSRLYVGQECNMNFDRFDFPDYPPQGENLFNNRTSLYDRGSQSLQGGHSCAHNEHRISSSNDSRNSSLHHDRGTSHHDDRRNSLCHDGRGNSFHQDDRRNSSSYDDRRNSFDHGGRDISSHHDGRDNSYHDESRNSSHHDGRDNSYYDESRNSSQNGRRSISHFNKHHLSHGDGYSSSCNDRRAQPAYDRKSQENHPFETDDDDARFQSWRQEERKYDRGESDDDEVDERYFEKTHGDKQRKQCSKALRLHQRVDCSDYTQEYSDPLPGKRSHKHHPRSLSLSDKRKTNRKEHHSVFYKDDLSLAGGSPYKRQRRDDRRGGAKERREHATKTVNHNKATRDSSPLENDSGRRSCRHKGLDHCNNHQKSPSDSDRDSDHSSDGGDSDMDVVDISSKMAELEKNNSRSSEYSLAKVRKGRSQDQTEKEENSSNSSADSGSRNKPTFDSDTLTDIVESTNTLQKDMKNAYREMRFLNRCFSDAASEQNNNDLKEINKNSESSSTKSCSLM